MGGESMVKIPEKVLPTIVQIKEITRKHSDEDIYTMLKECSMDPNETAQKLLYLDTFHEVKRKRDRRKENLNTSEDSISTPSFQGRGAKGGQNQRNNSSQFIPRDAIGGRNAAYRRENGIIHGTARGSPSQKTDGKGMPRVTRSSTAKIDGPKGISNGNYSHRRSPQPSAVGVSDLPRDSSAVDAIKLTAPSHPNVGSKQHPSPALVLTPTSASGVGADQGKSTQTDHPLTSSTLASVSGVYSSASDPVLVPSLISRLPAAVGTIGSQEVAAESNAAVLTSVAVSSTNREIPISSTNREIPSKSKDADTSQLSSNSVSHPPLQHKVPSEVVSSEVTAKASDVEKTSTKLHKSDGQHVIFPNHFQIPEAYKNGLTFGSFGRSFGLDSKFTSGPSENASGPEVHSSQESDETAQEPSVSNHNAAQEVEYPEAPQSPQLLSENISPLANFPSEDNASSSEVPKFDESKPDLQFPTGGGPQFPVQNAHNYSFGIVPPMLGSQFVQFEGSEAQARDMTRFHNLTIGNSLIPSTSDQTPSVSQPNGVVQSSLSVSPQPVPVFRQPYPSNYLPYNPYFSPYYMPPVHQFLSHSGFPQQPSGGNVYLPQAAAGAAAAATGVKFPLPQYKPGTTNSGNPTHIGIPNGYGSYTSSSVGYSPNTALNAGSSTGKDDLAASHLKENTIYTTGPQNDGSAVWIPAPGRDISGMQGNSFYNLHPQGQHLTFSPAQAGHAAFPGIYHPGQTSSIHHPFMQQQSQAMAGSVESAGPPPSSRSYQQPQGGGGGGGGGSGGAQMNWNNNY